MAVERPLDLVILEDACEEIDFSNPNPIPVEVPEVSIKKKSSRNLTRKASIAFNTVVIGGFAAGIVGFAAYGVNTYADNRNRDQDVRYEPVRRDQGLRGLETYYDFNNNDDDFEYMKSIVSSKYLISRDSFNYYSHHELIVDWGDDTQAFIDQQRYELVVEGAEILKKYYGVDDLDINTDDFSIDYPRVKKFDLKNTYDIVLLDALINSKLNQGTTDKPEEKYLQAEKFDDVKWLIDANLPIEIKENTFAYPDDDVLVYMSRNYRKIEALGYELPDKITFRPYSAKDSAAGFYIHEGQQYLTELARGSAIVHEEAHHQQKVNKQFGQDEYNVIVAASISEMINRGDSEGLLPFTYVSEYAKKNEHEDFAYTVEKYFADGVSFRRILNELRSTGNPAYIVWKAKYDFAKAYFGGEEFIKDGESFEPTMRDQFEVSIYPDGAVLLDTGNGTLKGGVSDKDVVEVLSTETKNLSSDDGTPLTFYQIRVVPTKSGDPIASEGWIWEGWLGDIKKHWESAVFEKKD